MHPSNSPVNPRPPLSSHQGLSNHSNGGGHYGAVKVEDENYAVSSRLLASRLLSGLTSSRRPTMLRIQRTIIRTLYRHSILSQTTGWTLGIHTPQNGLPFIVDCLAELCFKHSVYLLVFYLCCCRACIPPLSLPWIPWKYLHTYILLFEYTSFTLSLLTLISSPS